MVLFHISPLLPLLTNCFNAIQGAWNKAHIGLHTSQALSTWGDKWMGLLSQPAQTPPNVLCTPQAPLAFSKPQTHPRAGSSQEQAWAHGMPLGSKETNPWLSLQSYIETWRKGLFPLLGHSSHRDLLGEEKQDDTRPSSPENPSPAAQGKEQELLQKAGIAQGCFHNGIAQVSHLLSTFCTMGQVERVKNNVPKNHLLHQSLCTRVSKEWSMWSTNLFLKGWEERNSSNADICITIRHFC